MNDVSTQKMIANAVQALSCAYAPYSQFTVAACIKSGDQFFTGVNVENSSYGLTLCAESGAITQMIAAGSRIIEAIVILAENNKICPPCGACRQRIFEFADKNTQIYLCDTQTVLSSYTIEQLLPLAFNLDNNL
jgi:cytidine deaminase